MYFARGGPTRHGRWDWSALSQIIEMLIWGKSIRAAEIKEARVTFSG